MMSPDLEPVPRPTLGHADVVLRAPRPSDRDDRRAAGHDPDVARMYGVEPAELTPLTEREVDLWYRRLCRNPMEWVIDVAGHCIGNLRLSSMGEPSGSAMYAIGLFAESDCGRGTGTIVTRVVLRHGFERMELRRLGLRVLENNERAIACFRKCGFVEESREPHSVFIDDRWYSDILMSIDEDRYRRLSPDWWR